MSLAASLRAALICFCLLPACFRSVCVLTLAGLQAIVQCSIDDVVHSLCEIVISYTCRMLDMYGEVAAGLQTCLEHMGPWSLGDLVLGLRHVKQRHESHDVSDNIPGHPVSLASNPQIFQYLHRECSLAYAAYSIPDVDAITSEAQIAGNSDILHVHEATARFRPAFFVMKDTEASLFRVVVRGTNDLNDILTDIAGHWEPIKGGHAHSGILQSAEWLLEQTVPLLEDIPFQDAQPYAIHAFPLPLHPSHRDGSVLHRHINCCCILDAVCTHSSCCIEHAAPHCTQRRSLFPPLATPPQ